MAVPKPDLTVSPGKLRGARKAADDPEPEDRKGAILAAAAEIFHRKGFHATSIQDIASEVGMLKGSLYYYISSKDALLLQIITDVHEEAFSYLQDVLDSHGPAIQRIRRFIVSHTEYCASHQTGMGVYLHEYKALHGPARTKVMEMRDRYEVVVKEMIVSGQAEGSIRGDLDPRMAVKSMLGMTNWLYHWYNPKGPLSPTGIGESMADFALRGITSDHPRA